MMTIWVYDHGAIKELRKRLGLSQSQFAERLGLQKQQVSRYERGDTIPSVTLIASMCTAFEVSPTTFFGKTLRHNIEGNYHNLLHSTNFMDVNS